MNSQSYTEALKKLYGNHKQGNHFNRNLLPSPEKYYQEQLSVNPTRKKWVMALCPFHDDHRESLSVNLEHGGFFCHSCGAKGGNVLDFHMLNNNLRFKEAAKELGAWED